MPRSYDTRPPDDPLSELAVRQACRRPARPSRPMTEARFASRTDRFYAAFRQRALRDGVRLDYSAAELRRRVTRLLRGPGCAYCRTDLEAATFALDFKNPPRRGGRHALANVVLCCRRCRVQKGLLDWQEYRGLLELFRGWPVPVRHWFLARLRAGARCSTGRPPRPQPPTAA
jgi:5-methylcytosine-specific restriction endonuclease McrA